MNSGDANRIVARAKALGFDLCGVARAEKFPELAHAGEWLERGYAGEMKYLRDPRRGDLQQVLPGVRSVIVCALNYHAARPLSTEAARTDRGSEPRGWISRYAWGSDYHEVLRDRLEQLRAALHDCSAEKIESRVYVDSGPVPERVLAKYAGLGWIGKHTLLLNQKIGSFFFLGVILTTLDLEPSLGAAGAPAPDLCGSCRRCIDACPTAAIVEPYVMDASRCIAYLTIELRGPIPEAFREMMGWQVFGCDICQDVCPWNRRAPKTATQEFQPRELPIPVSASEPPGSAQPVEADSLYLPRLERLAAMDEAEFREAFRGSPLKRAKWRGLVRNACIALGNASIALQSDARQRIGSLLEKLAASEDAGIAESAQWALSRIQMDG